MHYVSLFADVYGAGSYDTNVYEGTGTSQSGSNTTGTGAGAGTTVGTGTSHGGILTDTGFDIALAATLACAIIFAALVVRFWKKPVAAKTTETD